MPSGKEPAVVRQDPRSARGETSHGTGGEAGDDGSRRAPAPAPRPDRVRARRQHSLLGRRPQVEALSDPAADRGNEQGIEYPVYREGGVVASWTEHEPFEEKSRVLMSVSLARGSASPFSFHRNRMSLWLRLLRSRGTFSRRAESKILADLDESWTDGSRECGDPHGSAESRMGTGLEPRPPACRACATVRSGASSSRIRLR